MTLKLKCNWCKNEIDLNAFARFPEGWKSIKIGGRNVGHACPSCAERIEIKLEAKITLRDKK